VPARVYAYINPKVLEWARVTAGYSLDEAAEKLGLLRERLARAESGTDEKLTVPKLREAANLYKRPLAAFFLPEPPKADEPLHDFRRAGDPVRPATSPALRLEMRQAEGRREEALELAHELGRPVRPFTSEAARSENPEDVGARVRRTLGVTESLQLAWKTPSRALKAWKSAVEGRDVLVFETSSVPLSEMRGFSFFDRKFPLIVLNGKDAEAGRIFTLLHEFAHLLLNQKSLCDPSHDFSGRDQDSRIEAFCNQVAGAAAVPLDLLLKCADSSIGPNNWTHEELSRIGRRLSISKEVALRRLVTAKRATLTHYQRMRQEFLAEYQQIELEKKGRKDKPVIVPRERLIARNLGRSFIELVFDAYGSDKISARELSESLGVKLNHLSKLEAEVFGKELA
jgi:Zn-dependent peptidase ImmA (M78 family)/transcriptional regulator with XRE-family HTH domain